MHKLTLAYAEQQRCVLLAVCLGVYDWSAISGTCKKESKKQERE